MTCFYQLGLHMYVSISGYTSATLSALSLYEEHGQDRV
jgi:hypothetical protein